MRLTRRVSELKGTLIVMGAVSRSAVYSDVMSTAVALLEHLPCDARVVKTIETATLLHS